MKKIVLLLFYLIITIFAQGVIINTIHAANCGTLTCANNCCCNHTTPGLPTNYWCGGWDDVGKRCYCGPSTPSCSHDCSGKYCGEHNDCDEACGPKCGDGHACDGVEECDDGDTDNTNGCDNTCILNCGSLTLNTADQMTRLSATQPLSLSWTYNQTNADTKCNPKSYTLYYVEKPAFDVSDKTDCDFTSATAVTVNDTTTANVTKIINNGSNPINWQKQYCWKIVVNKDASRVVESGVNTFRTNYAPLFSRAGIQFDDAGKTNMGDSTNIWGFASVNAGSPQCSTGWTSSCNTTTNSTDLNLGGNPGCWLAGYEATDSAGQDHTIFLWFEYFDPDNEPVSSEPNESQRHRLAFVKKDMFTQPLELDTNIQSSSSINNQNTLFYTYFMNLLQTQTPVISMTGSEAYITILEANRILFDNNKVRLIYKIKFTRPNPSIWWEYPYAGDFDIYTMMENNVDDPNIGFTGENLADHFGGSDPTTGKEYQKIGTLSIDTEEPAVGVNPPEVNGYHSFNLTWTDQTITEGSGLKDFKSYCYSDKTPNFNLLYLGPYSPFPETKVLEVIDINSIPAGYNECIPQNAKNEVIANGSATTQHSFGNDLSSYRRFDDLIVATINAEDNACNKKNDPYIDPQKLFAPWMTTRQGTVHSDGNINVSTPFETNSSIRTNNSLYYSSTSFYSNTPANLMRISSNMLSAGGTIPTNLSLNNQKVDTYFDLNFIPRFGPVAPDWYGYFKGLVQNAGLSSQIVSITGNRTIPQISTIDFGACSGPRCIYEITGNLTLGPTTPAASCDRQALVFINGNLIVYDDFVTTNANYGCIFIVKGNITFTNSINPYDATVGGNTAPYNQVSGFFITNSNSNKLIQVQKDARLVTGLPYADGLLIRGGMISDNFDFRRNLGLRNNIQPAEIILYDPRFFILFDDIFGYSMLNIRDK